MEVLCHDLKTERRDVSGGLPSYLKIVPVFFYLTLAVCTLGYTWFEVSRKRAARELERWESIVASHEEEISRIEKEREVIEASNDWAKEMAEWLEGAHHLQPLVVALGRGVGEEATIAEVLLVRNSEIPSQIHFTLKMDGVTTTVLDRTLEGIRKLHFRAYSAQQQKNEDSLDYNATLVFQNSLGLASR